MTDLSLLSPGFDQNNSSHASGYGTDHTHTQAKWHVDLSPVRKMDLTQIKEENHKNLTRNWDDSDEENETSSAGTTDTDVHLGGKNGSQRSTSELTGIKSISNKAPNHQPSSQHHASSQYTSSNTCMGGEETWCLRWTTLLQVSTSS